MKRIVSVSLGSSSRNHRVETTFLGEPVVIERIGTDGDRKRVIELIRSLDGEVDAFGMGGIDRYIYVNRRRYTFREAEKIAQAAKRTPILDGSGLKNTLERIVVERLLEHPEVQLRGKKVLLVSAVDRFGMAEALVQAGCEVVFGDLIFALGLPIPIRTLSTLERLAKVTAPLLTKLPISFLYPTGKNQEMIRSKYERFYREADVIAGDFHFIRRYLPENISGKVILTNTVTQEDIALLSSRGAHLLVTTTPQFDGRSFGTNVMEALLVALENRKADLRAEDYCRLLEQLGFEPYIQRLSSSGV
ncbi:quinate 5-dehydrogenase [Collibacillus ludicampi]|uniref:quinate 5-dehydrogenase n=1 Tax=Collibacillus ludicampi TaxID=2771369 RepID=UPI00249532AD|nr:quinate 5-dehydrogenase [Collibacillus ludicampi]